MGQFFLLHFSTHKQSKVGHFQDLNLNMNGVDVLLSDVQRTSQGFCQYTKEEKEKRIGRYRKKRNERNFNKKIKVFDNFNLVFGWMLFGTQAKPTKKDSLIFLDI